MLQSISGVAAAAAAAAVPDDDSVQTRNKSVFGSGSNLTGK
jgi:hypothetical protein